MRVHYIKILNDFADAIIAGEKTFEVRKNDRGYQKGDCIKFNAVDELGHRNAHIINDKMYGITFILSGCGIEKDYVVFSISEV